MKISKTAMSIAAASAALTLSAPAQAGIDPFVGQIMTGGYNFCPRNTLPADGQLIPIPQNPALFALLGTRYGGNGTTTFALPNLNGRTVIGHGQGPGLPDYQQGQQTGSATITLTANNLPAHTHTGTLRAQSGAGNTNQPGGNSLALAPSNRLIYSAATPANNMNAGDITVAPSGGGEPIRSEMPYLALQQCIAMQGIFPPRP